MGCGASALDNLSDKEMGELLRPRVHRGAVQDVLAAFADVGVPSKQAIMALEKRRVLPGNHFDLCVALRVDPSYSLEREAVLYLASTS